MKRFMILVLPIIISGCVMVECKQEIICPTVEKRDESGEYKQYCLIPFVEMQANYVNLDGYMIAVDGYLSVINGEVDLVSPSVGNHMFPKPYNVVALELKSGFDADDIAVLHGKYVTAFGRFKAKFEGREFNLIAHSIQDVEIVESSP